MIIDINKDFIKVSAESSGKMINKFVDKDTLVSLLLDQQGVSTPLLPLGTRMFTNTSEGCTILYETPSVFRQFTFVGGARKKIYDGKMWWPRLLFVLRFVRVDGGWRFVTETKVAALNNPLVSADQPLYFPPLGNLYPDHKVCWGSTFSGSPDILNLSDLSFATRFVEFYFNSQFNSDLGIRFNKVDGLPGQQRAEDVYRYLEKKDSFDINLLQKSSYTLRSLEGA